MGDIIVKIENLNKNYKDKVVLKDFHLEVEQGEFLVISGVSGCGKSTLLNIIGLLDKGDSGTVELFHHKEIKPFSKKAEKLLKEQIGYLFQNFALIEDETVYENLSFMSKDKDKIKEALSHVGLENYENKKVYQCSGGEQQRIALARLLLKPCSLILADEPTGSLDKENRDRVMELLKEMNNQGKTIILVTHDLELYHYGTRVIQMK